MLYLLHEKIPSVDNNLLLEYIENLKENFEEKNYNQNDVEIINNFNDIENNNNKNIIGVNKKKQSKNSNK